MRKYHHRRTPESEHTVCQISSLNAIDVLQILANVPQASQLNIHTFLALAELFPILVQLFLSRRTVVLVMVAEAVRVPYHVHEFDRLMGVRQIDLL